MLLLIVSGTVLISAVGRRKQSIVLLPKITCIGSYPIDKYLRGYLRMPIEIFINGVKTIYLVDNSLDIGIRPEVEIERGYQI